MTQLVSRPRLWAALSLFSLFMIAQGQLDLSATALPPAFSPLKDISKHLPDRSVFLGGQNFTTCCLQAIRESYTFQNGVVNQVADPTAHYLNLTSDEFAAEQFPCGAQFQFEDEGAPIVAVPYSWCYQNCGGWQRSTNQGLSQWIQPFVGFILPAAVFCLNVPRKRPLLPIPDWLFRSYRDVDAQFGILKIAFLAVFASQRLSGPGSGSGLFKRIGKLISEIGISGRILFFVFIATVFWATIAALLALIGTILWVVVVFSTAGPMTLSGLYEATLDRKVIETVLGYLALKEGSQDQAPEHGARDQEANGAVTIARPGEKPLLRKHVHLLFAVLVGNLSQNPPGSSTEPHSEQRSAWSDVEALVNDGNSENTKTRFKAMLNCQASFGATIGAPVVFFLGSFLFNAFSTLTTAGDNDTSHALAFGQWWMTIVHVAVLSGCLLAGNNPSTLEVAVCGYFHDYRASSKPSYVPVWMWERGRSKREWIRRVQRQWGDKAPRAANPKFEEEKYFDLDAWHWVFAMTVFIILLGVPFMLALLTSYYTPLVGLSCRSMTFLIYFCSQVWLCIGWLFDFRHRERSPLLTKHHVPTWFCLFMAVGYAVAVFMSLAGTFLQLLGVYRNCLCKLPVWAWARRDTYMSIPISSNTADDIYYSKKFWLPTSIVSIVVLVVVVYVGWWYQRHWRMRFTKLIRNLPTDFASERREGSVPTLVQVASGNEKGRDATAQATGS